MDNSKVLTVIVAAYNMERLLPRCLESMVISPEAMGKLEVLIVNDGSTDGTSRIAHGYESQYPGTFVALGVMYNPLGIMARKPLFRGLSEGAARLRTVRQAARAACKSSRALPLKPARSSTP